MVQRSAYHGDTKCLSEYIYTIRIQHKIHTTCLYITPIKHANRKIKLAFIEVIKRRHIYLDMIRIQFILTHNTNKAEIIGSRKTD